MSPARVSLAALFLIILLTKEFFSAKLLTMKIIHKKIIGAFLPIPFFFAITFCYCLERDASADEGVAETATKYHQELDKSHHSEHQDHSEGDHECTCPKHFSFFSEQSVDIVFDSSFSRMLAKNLMANLRFESIVLLASLPSHSQGPPFQDRLDCTIPSYLKISNLRI